ncbi:hypothetical protein LOD99_13792 [Oopsacas minuta]|uniref:CHHC U11-48K-type domain-containing protein n=1 Tax=Oopsacas minuta TaxID=111878 RepID=A0AAV7KJG5_9METZ|nr:hypothetical protein LOD99_13792 [Oopsacas minuta]
MSLILDPDDLVVCPYDPVHRVAAKKLPYHISKCRKQYDKYVEYRTCPFNARHVVPAPEFQYHMETCDAKGAIDMEIAFEQSKHEVSNTTKGCTDIPPVPNWDKPDQTENWDNEDEDALPVLKPQPINKFDLPPNVLRPTPRPISKFESNTPPYSRKMSPNRFSSPDSRKSPHRGGRNVSGPRSYRDSPVQSYHGDEHLPLPTVEPRSTPDSDNGPIVNQEDFPPLPKQPSSFKPITKYHDPPTTSSRNQKVIAPPPPQQRNFSRTKMEEIRVVHLSQSSQQESPSFTQISDNEQRISPRRYEQELQPQQPPLPPPPPPQPIYNYQQQQQQHIPPYQQHTQPLEYTNQPPAPLPPQSYQQPYPPHPQQVFYNPHIPANDLSHYIPPAMQVPQPSPNYYMQQQQQQQQQQPLPPQQYYHNPQHPNTYHMQPSDQYYAPQQSYNPNPQPNYSYQYASPSASQVPLQRAPGPRLNSAPEHLSQNPSHMHHNPPPNQVFNPVLQGNNFNPSGVAPTTQCDQSSFVSSSNFSPGRGRARGVYTGPPPKSDHRSTQNPYSIQSLAPQMEQLQLSMPQQQLYPHHQGEYTEVHSNMTNTPHQYSQQSMHTNYNQQSNPPNQIPDSSMSHSTAQAPSQTQPETFCPSQTMIFEPHRVMQYPKPGGAANMLELDRVKFSLAHIQLIEHKREKGSPLTKEEEDLLASKSSLSEKLKA